MLPGSVSIRRRHDRRFLHWDSTSRSFHGDYERKVSEDGVHMTYSHSKDHRPDLKQTRLSLLTNRQGSPLWGEVHAGNASGKNLNTEVIARTRVSPRARLGIGRRFAPSASFGGGPEQMLDEGVRRVQLLPPPAHPSQPGLCRA